MRVVRAETGAVCADAARLASKRLAKSGHNPVAGELFFICRVKWRFTPARKPEDADALAHQGEPYPRYALRNQQVADALGAYECDQPAFDSK